jgi:hypothetical protein
MNIYAKEVCNYMTGSLDYKKHNVHWLQVLLHHLIVKENPTDDICKVIDTFMGSEKGKNKQYKLIRGNNTEVS